MPSVTPLILEELLARISAGETLTAVCEDEHMISRASVYALARNDEAFAQRLTHAMDSGMDAWGDETIQIADDVKADPDPASRKLRVQTRQWIMARRSPLKYSERLRHDHDHTGGIDLHVHGTFPTAEETDRDTE